jgi:hypothetical protein
MFIECVGIEYSQYSQDIKLTHGLFFIHLLVTF